LKAERKLRFQFEAKVKAQLMGPQSLVPTVFFPALGEVAVRKDALHLHAEIAEAALHAGAASLTELKGDLDWKTLQVKVQTGVVADERAKLAGLTGVLDEVRKDAKRTKKLAAAGVEKAVSALNAEAAACTELKGDLDWKTVQMKVQTGLVAEERAKLAGVTRDLQHERKSAEKVLLQFGRRSSAALDGVRKQLECETTVAADVNTKSEAALAAERKKVARALAGRAKAEEKNAALEDDLDALMEEVFECCVYFTSCLVPVPYLLPCPLCHLHSPLLCHTLGGEGKGRRSLVRGGGVEGDGKGGEGTGRFGRALREEGRDILP
jgi:hypothetical protein